MIRELVIRHVPHYGFLPIVREFDTATGEVSEWPVYDREQMAPGATVRGPAIVAEDETSTLVPPGWTCRPGSPTPIWAIPFPAS